MVVVEGKLGRDLDLVLHSLMLRDLVLDLPGLYNWGGRGGARAKDGTIYCTLYAVYFVLDSPVSWCKPAFFLPRYCV